MSAKRIRLLMWKEFLQFRRDPLLLPLLFIMPVLQLVMFGYVVGADVTNVTTAVVDLDRTSLSRELGRQRSQLRATSRSRSGPTTRRDLRPLLDRGDVQVAIVIPEGTESQVTRGARRAVGIIVDGTDSRIASVGSGYAAQIISAFNAQRLAEQGLVIAGPGLDARVRVLFNPTLRAVNSMIPGLMATILMLSMTSIMSQAVVRERERGTLEQMFVTPITRGEYLVGKLTPYVLIAIVQMSSWRSSGALWFRVPFNGSVWVVVLGLLLFLLTTIGLGLFISLVSHTRQQAQQTVMFILIPTLVLSGFIFPDRVDASRSSVHLPHPPALRARGVCAALHQGRRRLERSAGSCSRWPSSRWRVFGVAVVSFHKRLRTRRWLT